MIRDPAFLRLLTRDLVLVDVPGADEREAQLACEAVRGRVRDGAAPVVLGVLAASALTLAATCLLARRPYSRLPEGERLELARRLGRTRAPIASDLVRVVRSIGIASVLEERSARQAAAG